MRCRSRENILIAVIAFERRLDSQRLLVIVPRRTYTVGLWPTGDVWKESVLTGFVPARDARLAGRLLTEGPHLPRRSR